MTAARDRVYAFLTEYTLREGFPPTVREIAGGCGTTVGTAAHHLNRLETEGLITTLAGSPRAIRINALFPMDLSHGKATESEERA